MTEFLKWAYTWKMAWIMGTLTTLIAACTVWKAATDSIDSATWSAMACWDRVNKVYILVLVSMLNNVKAYLDSSVSRARQANGTTPVLGVGPMGLIIAGGLILWLVT